MNRYWLSVRQRILFKVLLLNYQAYFLFFNARDLRSNNKLLVKPCQSVARIKIWQKTVPTCCTNEWNELPLLIIRESPSLDILRQH